MASKMNLQQIVLLGEVLKECCTSVDGCAIYKPGCSDETVLKAVIDRNHTDRPFTMFQVGGMRRDLFGNLPSKVTAPVVNSDLINRIELLERNVLELMLWKDEVIKRFGPVTTHGRPGRPHSTPPVE